jgi:hypothetical protein
MRTLRRRVLASSNTETGRTQGEDFLKKGQLWKKCKRGHILEPPNLIFRTVKGQHHRECRTCANERFKRMRQAKKEKAASQPDPLEEIVKEVLAEVEPDGTLKESAIDPMEFLEPTAEAPVQADDAFGPVEPCDPESPHAPLVVTGLTEIGPVTITLDDSNSTHKQRSSLINGVATGASRGFDHVVSNGQPTAQDLDSLADEQRAAIATDTQHIDIPALIEAQHRKAFEDAGVSQTEIVPVPKPTEKANGKQAALKPTMRPNCGHGFSSAFICPQCRANGVR